MEGDPYNHSPEPTPWEKALAIAKEEALWLLTTMGMITLSLAIGRLISKLTGSGAVDPGAFSATWNEHVDKALRQKEGGDGNSKLH
jgi:hypothetical protein